MRAGSRLFLFQGLPRKPGDQPTGPSFISYLLLVPPGVKAMGMNLALSPPIVLGTPMTGATSLSTTTTAPFGSGSIADLGGVKK